MIMKKQIVFVMIVGVVFVCLALYFFGPAQQKESAEVKEKEQSPVVALKDESSDVMKEDKSSVAVLKDEPAARALYEKMIETMCKTESISYKSDYKFEVGGKPFASCTYTAWIKKPNYVRIETDRAAGQKAGTLIGDGDYLWIYWLGEPPAFSHEEQLGKSSEKTRFNVYMKEATPTGKDSIRYKTSRLGAGMKVPVIDPSTFHGYGHMISLKPHIHGIKNIGTEKVNDIDCDVIELLVEVVKDQKQKYQFWLSKGDHLPRKLKRVIIRKNGDIVIDELWSDVTVNAEILMEKFAWTPPEGWNQYHLPDPEE